jgi:outer membrane receptor protein involved in Fe transport
VNNTIDAANLERIEVIKGPSGTLYGSSLSSYGGLINRVTKKPYDKAGGEIGFSTGSYDLNRISADINSPLDSAHQVLLRVNTAYSNAGSFQDNGFNRNFVFDPSFVFKVNDRLTLSFDAEISHADATTPVMYFFNTTVADLGVNRADKLKMDYKKSYQSNDLDNTSDNSNFLRWRNTSSPIDGSLKPISAWSAAARKVRRPISTCCRGMILFPVMYGPWMVPTAPSRRSRISSGTLPSATCATGWWRGLIF